MQIQTARLLSVAITVALLIGCCSSDAIQPADTPAPTGTPTSIDEPTQTVLLAPGPDLSEFRDFEEVSHLLDEVGPERGFPTELLSTSVELSKDESKEAWRSFIENSRVIATKGREIREVTDYCVNTRTTLYSPLDGGWSVGEHTTWSIEHTEFTDWNTPRLVAPNPGGEQRYSFLSRNYSGLGGAWLFPPENGGSPRSVSGSILDLRVFDHPECQEISPAIDISAGGWSLLFPAGKSSRIDEIIAVDSPQLPVAEVIAAWELVTSDVVLFYNLNKTPHTFFCADGTGIDVGRYFAKDVYGKSFRWHYEDARQVVKNAAWLKIDYDDNNVASRQVLTDIEAMTDPYSLIIGLRSSDCSIETGVAYLESIDLPPGFKGPIDPKGSGGYAQ